MVAPKGWIVLDRLNASNALGCSNSLAVYIRVVTNYLEEPTNYVWSFTGTFQAAVGGILGFASVNTLNPINAENGRSNAGVLNSNSASSTPSITTTVADSMLVTVFCVSNNDAWSPPEGSTERVDVVSSTGFLALAINTAPMPMAGATGALTAHSCCDASDANNAIVIALRPL